MIAYKTLIASGSGLNTFEAEIGGSGGQPDWNGYIISTTANNVTVNLPKASVCEGKAIQFVSLNASSRTIIIACASGDAIILTGNSQTTLTASAPRCQTNLFCDGTSWWAFGDGSFV